MNRQLHRFLALLAVLAPMAGAAQNLSGKKILFLSSYHQGYAWNDGVEAGAASVLKGSGVEMQTFRLDAKRHPEPKAVREAGQKALALIANSRPDLVIVSDDIGTKLMVDNFKNTAMPWVFCGVNWDASRYGLPFKNTTGMVEVGPVEPLIQNLKVYAKGTRVGYLTADVETERTDQAAYRDLLKINFTQQKLVKSMAEWNTVFERFQGEVDVLLLGNNAGLPDWSEPVAAAWAMEHGKIPTGTIYDWMMPYTMLGVTKVADEQGIWAAKAALRILRGEAPASIPLARNKDGKLYVNVNLASKAGVVFKPEIISNAQVLK